MSAHIMQVEHKIRNWPNKLIQMLLLSVFSVASPLFAQNTFPQNQSPNDIKPQIRRLEIESRVVDEMIRQAALGIYTNTDTALHSGTDAVLGPIFGREKDYNQLIEKVEAVNIAVKSGNSTFAVHQAVEAYKQAAELLSRPIALLTGEPFQLPTEEEIVEHPEKLVSDVHTIVNEAKQIKSDLNTTAQALGGLGQGMEAHEALLQIKHRINEDKKTYQQQLLTVGSSVKATAIDTGDSQGNPNRHDSSNRGTINEFDPSKLTPQEREGWLRNQAIVANETLGKSTGKAKDSVTGNSEPTSTAQVTFDPSKLTSQEREGWLRNQANVANETLPKSIQQQSFDWAANTFPDVEGPGSEGIQIPRPQSDRSSPEGLIAHNTVSGNLLVWQGDRYIRSVWTVNNGDTVIGRGFTDIQFPGGGRFLGKYLDRDGYALFDAKTGNQISAQHWTSVQVLGDGYFAAPSRTGVAGMMDIVSVSGDVALTNAFPAYTTPQYLGNGQVLYQSLGRTLSIQVPPAQPRYSFAPVANPTPATGGIYLGGQQQYQTNDKVDDEFDKAERNANKPPEH